MNASNRYITLGTSYEVVNTSSYHVYVVDDEDDEDSYHYREFKLAVATAKAVPVVPAKHAKFTQTKGTITYTGKAPLTAPVTFHGDGSVSVHDEEDKPYVSPEKYPSIGLFNIGDRLVYRDGTATITSLTVKRCSATCVWFEETYSQPFNPNEFEKEY